MTWLHNVGGASPLGRWIGLKPNSAASREDALRLRPVRNPLVTWEPHPGPSLKGREEDEPTPGPSLKGREKDEPTPGPSLKGREEDEPTPGPLPETEAEEGLSGRTVLLTVPRKKDGVTNFIARVLQAPGEKRIELDEFGSAIWERCDGTRTVDELARFTSTAYKLNRRQAEVSVMAFMKMLSQRRLIGFITEGKGVSDVSGSARQRAAKRRRSGERKRRF